MCTAPSNVPKIRDALRRLFRIYAHIYHHHVVFFDDIGEMKLLQVRSFSQRWADMSVMSAAGS
jgi:hypothetical protein